MRLKAKRVISLSSLSFVRTGTTPWGSLLIIVGSTLLSQELRNIFIVGNAETFSKDIVLSSVPAYARERGSVISSGILPNGGTPHIQPDHEFGVYLPAPRIAQKDPGGVSPDEVRKIIMSLHPNEVMKFRATLSHESCCIIASICDQLKCKYGWTTYPRQIWVQNTRKAI
jgi:hypothetical protein